jgi:hypothetical protein
MKTKLLFAIVCLTVVAIGCSKQTATQPQQASQTSQSANPVFKVVSVSRVNEWAAPDEMEGLTLTKGVSVTAVGGNFGTFQAEPDYEIAVVKVQMTGAPPAGVPLEDVSVSDDKGKKYSNVAKRSALKKENTEFGFAVPVKTALTKIDLNQTISLDLSQFR